MSLDTYIIDWCTFLDDSTLILVIMTGHHELNVATVYECDALGDHLIIPYEGLYWTKNSVLSI